MQDEVGAVAPDVIEELVRKAQDGDAASFAGLYERHYDRIFRYVLFKIGDATDAEDITEEVFLKMLESIRSFRWRGPPFSSWLFRIAHNLVVDHYRKKSRRQTTSLEDAGRVVGASSNNIDRHLDIRLSMREVLLAMEQLTELQKEVISLRFAGGLSIMETAQSMGKKENAVKALQHAGISRLRSLLTARSEESPDRPVPQWSP
jgi:RNA polymerase sigma-70 factor (ECF subfamily)